MKRRNFLRIGSIALLAFLPLILPLADSAADEAKKEPAAGFDALPEAQKALVKKNWERFKEFSPERKQELMRAFGEMQKLTPEQKKKIQENYNHWKSLSPTEQAEVKRKYNSWSSLSEQEKEAMRERLDKYNALSEPEKAGLVDSLRKKDNTPKADTAK